MDKQKVTPAAYEVFVTELVSQLTFAENAVIYRNERFPDVRQPGSYEIDIALEFDLDVLRFLLIVECKHWKRPVDRPVVQKLAQTRDAISAQKAAIAPPAVFTAAAVDVAENLGIALWVISRPISWTTIMAYRSIYFRERILARRRAKIHRRIGYIPPMKLRARHPAAHANNEDDQVLVTFDAASDTAEGHFRFKHSVCTGSALPLQYWGECDHPPHAIAQILDALIDSIGRVTLSKRVYCYIKSMARRSEERPHNKTLIVPR